MRTPSPRCHQRARLASWAQRAAEGLCGWEIVQVSPPHDVSDITSLMALRIAVDVLGSMVANGKLGVHKHIIDKEFVPF